MPLSRGLKIYLGLHVAATGATLAVDVASKLAGVTFPGILFADLAATLFVYLQTQLLAVWIVLGSERTWARLLGGAAATCAVLALVELATALETELIWFPLKIIAATIVLPMALVAVGMTPELIGRRRIRYANRDCRTSTAPPQFSLRALFVATVLAAALIGVAQFFPLQFVYEEETPFNSGVTAMGTVSLSTAILGVPAAVVAAAWLLLPGRIRWLIPMPIVTGFLAGVAVTAAELRGVSVEAFLVGAGCAVASLAPIGHFLILRACGYRLVDESFSEPAGRPLPADTTGWKGRPAKEVVYSVVE